MVAKLHAMRPRLPFRIFILVDDGLSIKYVRNIFVILDTLSAVSEDLQYSAASFTMSTLEHTPGLDILYGWPWRASPFISSSAAASSLFVTRPCLTFFEGRARGAA